MKRELVTGRPVRWRWLSLIVQPRLVTVTVLLAVAAVVLGMMTLTMGAVSVPLDDLPPALLGQHSNARHNLVVHQMRLPRVLVALVAGAALGVSGAVFQSISANALGSPDVIGLTTGAATGAISQIVLLQADPLQVALGALVGGLGTSAVIYLLSLKGGVTGGHRLVLIGLGVGSLLSSVNALMMVRGDVERAFSANVWLSGSLDDVKWGQASPTLVVTLLVLPLVASMARRATLLEMGDDMAQQLGIRGEPTRRWLILLAVLLAGIATSAIGPIAFIALASPQLARILTRSTSLPVFSAAAMGAVILTGALLITSLLPGTVTLPIGQVTGLLGGMYLAWLLTRTRQV